MKFDVYKVDEDKFLIYKRGEVSTDGELPEGNPDYEAKSENEVYEWCDAHSSWMDINRIRMCTPVGTYPAAFVNDLKEKAQKLLNRYISEGAEAGWGELTIDFSWMSYTYRRSAAWKDEPTYYTFHQSLKWTNKKDKPLTGFPLRARDNLVQLWGMADAAHELGLEIVFDKQFKVSVFGINTMWKESYED